MRSLPSRYTSRRLLLASSRKPDTAGLRSGDVGRHEREAEHMHVAREGVRGFKWTLHMRHRQVWASPMLLGSRHSQGNIFFHPQRCGDPLDDPCDTSIS